MIQILNFIGGVKGAVIILIILAFAGYTFYLKNSKENVEKELAVAKSDIEKINEKIDIVIDANKTNQETIDYMKAEKDQINEALNTLAKAQLNNRLAGDKRDTIILNQSKLPENTAVTAPVISDIIIQIQQDRILRRQ